MAFRRSSQDFLDILIDFCFGKAYVWPFEPMIVKKIKNCPKNCTNRLSKVCGCYFRLFLDVVETPAEPPPISMLQSRHIKKFQSSPLSSLKLHWPSHHLVSICSWLHVFKSCPSIGPLLCHLIFVLWFNWSKLSHSVIKSWSKARSWAEPPSYSPVTRSTL